MFRADLHCHTTCSDGTLTPEELLHRAKQEGLNGLSITDHDTVAAYKAAIPLAATLEILLGVGVEFSSILRDTSIHILGYDFDLESPAILTLCQRHKKRRQVRNQRILERLSRLSMLIHEEELLAVGKGTVGRPHIAEIMMKKGYVRTMKEAFDLYIGDGKPCFDPGEGISSEETIWIIHQGGGKAFIAHPHILKHQNKLKELLKLPFDGIECYYSRSLPGNESRFLRIAKEKGWLISGGSDFHGDIKAHVPLGCSWVDEACFHQIFQRL